MSWMDALPLDYSEPHLAKLHGSLKQAYRQPKVLKVVAELAGIDTSYINFAQPVALLPMEVLDQAAGQARMVPLLAEILADPSARAIHSELMDLLGTELPRVHESAIAKSPTFERRAELPASAEYELNGRRGNLQVLLQALPVFNDPALFRLRQERAEARVARIEYDGNGVGTGFLVGPDLLLTAWHVVAKCLRDDRNGNNLAARFDKKIIPGRNGVVLADGRKIRFAGADPLQAKGNHASDALEFSEDGPLDPELLDFALLRLAVPIGKQGLATDGRGDTPRGWFTLPKVEPLLDPDMGLFVLGHPQLNGPEAGPLKLTCALPSMVTELASRLRIRYRIDTLSGNSGSPVLNQDFQPLFLHHGGTRQEKSWDMTKDWPKGFNQGVPLHKVTNALIEQVSTSTAENLGFT